MKSGSWPLPIKKDDPFTGAADSSKGITVGGPRLFDQAIRFKPSMSQITVSWDLLVCLSHGTAINSYRYGPFQPHYYFPLAPVNFLLP
jgi:hypothetical protein